MEQKSLEDWTLQKHSRMCRIVDVASFGGITKEYQIRLDPDKLITYGLSISQVEHNCKPITRMQRSFIVAGAQQINVQAQGLYENVQQIENTLIKTQAGTPIACGYCECRTRRRSGLARFRRRTNRSRWIRMATSITTTTISSTSRRLEGSLLLRKGADADPVLKAVEKSQRDHDHVCRKCFDSSFLDRSDLVI